MADKLSRQQQLFIEALQADPKRNATAAYRKAYPSCKSEEAAAAAAARTLRSAKVRSALAAADKARAQRVQVQVDDVLREAMVVAFSDIGLILDFSGAEPRLRPAHQITEQARRSISSIKVKRHLEGPRDNPVEVEVTEFKLWPKSTAIEQLFRHLGLYKERDPLEVLLAALPPEVGTAVRRELGRLLQPGGGPAGGAAADAADGPG